MQSMTGFGRGTAEDGGCAFVAEARSVNHRYLDVAVRVPREYAGLEDRIRAQVRARVGRGRIDVSVAVSAQAPGERGVRVDTALAARYHKLLQDLAAHLSISSEVDAGFFLGLPGVLEVRERLPDGDADWPAIEAAVAAALQALEAMRGREGTALGAALERGLATVRACLERVASRAPVVAAEQVARVRTRLEALQTGAAQGEAFPFDPAARLERVDISEELERLRSHLEQAAACLSAPGPVGRRLEFLAQEMQREWGTISAKASDRAIADDAVSARVAVEQVREQVQNIE